MKKIFFLGLALISLVTISSCKKAGLGGDATLAVFPEHHSKPIYGATVYVKFNSKESPGIGNYDAVYTGEANEDHVHIKELMQGDYYLYSIGYDSAISQMVYGGQSFTIKRKERKDELTVHLAVTE